MWSEFTNIEIILTMSYHFGVRNASVFSSEDYRICAEVSLEVPREAFWDSFCAYTILSEYTEDSGRDWGKLHLMPSMQIKVHFSFWEVTASPTAEKETCFLNIQQLASLAVEINAAAKSFSS